MLLKCFCDVRYASMSQETVCEMYTCRLEVNPKKIVAQSLSTARLQTVLPPSVLATCVHEVTKAR